MLLLAAIVALLWANNAIAESYEHFWNAELTIGIGHLTISRSLHFLVNDGLMTVFFLVVGAEIRQEISDGALSSFKRKRLVNTSSILMRASRGLTVISHWPTRNP
ncbi:hypothetical protein AL048_21460 [Pseudomonas syringae pv. castaneae]|nr:hypothetical protein AL048_21460 [Pseudomonas syringae pv. castaneae]